MKSFNFSLTKLLDYRNMQEEEAKRELGLRNMHLEKEMNKLGVLQREEQMLFKKLTDQSQAYIHLPLLQLTQEYSRVLDRRLMLQVEEKLRSQKRLEEQREATRQCWRKKRVLELLRDKALIEHVKQEQVEERKLVDELVINRINRKGGDE